MTEQEAKRTQVSVHLSEPLRVALEQAAKREVRSLSGEISYRLQRSFDRQPHDAA